MTSRRTIASETKMLSIFDIANDFEPKDEVNPNARYKIPEHQRFYQWKNEQEVKLIDSIIQGYPIPSIIACEYVDTERGTLCYSIEDGQQRLTALRRFITGKFSFENKYYPYNTEEQGDVEFMSRQDCRYLELCQVPVTVFRGEIDVNTKAEIFHRLNNGKKLTQDDKFWSKKETPMVKYTLTVLKSEDAQIIGKYNFGPRRSGLSGAVGLVIGLSEGNDNISTSYEKNYPLLKNSPNQDKVEKGIKFISNIYKNVKTSGLDLNTTERTSLGKILSILIHEFNNNYSNNIQLRNLEDFWTEFLKIVARNSTEFWNVIVTGSARGANLTQEVITERIVRVQRFMSKNDAERYQLCQTADIMYVSE